MHACVYACVCACLVVTSVPANCSGLPRCEEDWCYTNLMMITLKRAGQKTDSSGWCSLVCARRLLLMEFSEKMMEGATNE